METNRDKESFSQDSLRGTFAAINGVLLSSYFWAILLVLVLQLTLGDNYKPVIESNPWIEVLINIIVIVLTAAVSIFILNPKVFFKSIKKYKKKDWIIIPIGVVVIISFTVLYNLILVASGINVGGGNENQSAIMAMKNSSLVLTLFMVTIFAPIGEEITYRYAIYGTISKYNKIAAFAVSALVFTLVHASVIFTSSNVDYVRELLLLPPYFFSGLVLAYCYDKSENLLVSITTHSIYNLVVILLSLI